MNLQSIYLKCRDNITAIENLKASDAKEKNAVGGDVSVKKVVNWNAALTAIKELEDIEYLKPYLQNLVATIPEIYITEDSFLLSIANWNAVSNKRDVLVRAMQDVINLYESMGLEPGEKSDQIGFNVLIPECHDFNEYASYVKDLATIFDQCPYLKDDNEKIEFEGTDVGSLWLTFAVIIGAGLAIDTGSRILNNLASFIDKCIIISSHKATLEQQKAQNEVEEKNEHDRQVIENYLVKGYKRLCDETFAELNEEAGITDNNEEKSRAKMTAEKMNSLIEKGVRIYAAIDAPKEVQALFEPLEMKLIDNKVSAKIEKKDDPS